MIRAHMTKTHKISLLVTLLLAFVALISAAFILPKSASAADMTNVEQFDAYMQGYVELDKIDEETLCADENRELWSQYIAARTLYNSTLTETERGQITTKETFEAVNAIFDDVYDLVVKNSQMHYVVNPDARHPATYASSEKVKEINDAYTLLSPNLQKVLNAVTENLKNTKEAEKVMASYLASLQEIYTAISQIQYFDTQSNTLATGYTVGKENARIVLASKTTIEAVRDKIKAYDKDAFAEDGTFDIEKFEDAKYVKGSAGEEDYTCADFAEAYSKYNAELKKAADVTALIEEAQAAVAGGAYYTNNDKIVAAREAYDALANEENKALLNGDGANQNDLQSLVDETPLTAMEQKIEEIKTAIDNVLKAIKAVNEGTPKYSTWTWSADTDPVELDATYENLIKAAEALFDALDQDIKDHDTALEGLEAEYFVKNETENYGQLVAARAQFDKWGSDVKTLKERIDAIIPDYLSNSKDVYSEAIDIQSVYTNMTQEQKDAFNELTEFGQDEQQPPKPVKKSYINILNEIIATINEAYAQVQDVNADIASVYKSGNYTYADRDAYYDVKKAYEEKIAEDPSLKIYISNFEQLEAMTVKFKAADVAVAAWIQAVLGTDVEVAWNAAYTADEQEAMTTALAAWINEKLPETGITDKIAVAADVVAPVTVENWQFVKEAKTLYDALNNAAEGFSDVQSVVMGTAVNGATQTEQEENAWNIFNTAKTELESLETAFKSLNEGLTALVNDPELDIDSTDTWSNTVNGFIATYEGLTTLNGVPADPKYTKNQEYFQTTYPEAWAKYQEALTYIDRYNAEGKIRAAWKAAGGTSQKETTDPLNVQLSHKNVINEAAKAYNDYIEKYTEEKAGDIRNAAQLTKLQEELDKLTETLDLWVVKVVKLANPDFDETTRGKDLWDEVAKWTTDFKGYPLDISKKGESDGKGGQYADDGEWVALYAEYKTLTGSDTDTLAKVEYLFDALTLYDALNQKSTAAIEALNADVAEIKGLLEQPEGHTFTAVEMDKIDRMTATYNAMDPSQQVKVNWKDIAEAVAKNQATHAFDDMVKALYEDVVTNGNITSLTKYYINAIKSIYAAFTTEYQGLVDASYNDKMTAIENAYNAAVEAKTVVELDDVKKALDELTKTVGNNKNELDQKITDEIAKLQALIDTINNETIKGINDKIDALTQKDTAIDGQITDINGKIAGIMESLSALEDQDDALEQAIQTQVKALQDALEARIAALESWKTTADGDISTAKSDIAALQKALGDIENIQSAIDAMGGKVSKELGDQIAALQTDVGTKIAALEKRINDLAQADQDIQGQIDKLQEQTDSLKSDVTALMAVLIVVSVITAGLAVCVVLLFLKRKK